MVFDLAGAGTSQAYDFAGEYSKWCQAFTDAPPQFHRYVAYWVVSTLVGRNVYCHFGDEWLFPNLWMVLLAPSSFYRKSTALNIGSRMVSNVKPEVVMPAQFSQECLVALLSKQPHAAFVYYEFKSLLTQMQKDYNSGLQSLLTELFDSPQEYIRKTGVHNVIEMKVEKPYLTILSASTVDWLLSAVKGGDIAGGFLARFIFVGADSKPKSMAFQPTADQVKKIELRNAAALIGSETGRMEYDVDARKYYEIWYEGFIQECESAPEGVRVFFPRLTTYAHKFAMLESLIGLHHRHITLSDARAGCMMAENLAQEITDLAGQSLGSTGFQVHADKLLRTIQKHPGADRRMLMRSTHYSADWFRKVTETLQQTGQIEVRGDKFFVAVTSGDNGDNH